jgi:D-glycero-beta-D-manno-heptose 1-phosphate adenylyltransferase
MANALIPLRAKEISNLMIRDPELRVIRDRQMVLRYRQYFQEGGMKVGFVGGVYDMIHDGHMLYLMKCLDLCDILIVALDDDELTRKRKNDPSRPFDSELVRAKLLCYGCLAHIVTFRGVDEHPYDLIKLLEPDVLVTSQTTSDVTDADREVLRQHCGEVTVLQGQSSESTTAKFRRLRIQTGVETAHELLMPLNQVFGPLGIEFTIKNGGENGQSDGVPARA